MGGKEGSEKSSEIVLVKRICGFVCCGVCCRARREANGPKPLGQATGGLFPFGAIFTCGRLVAVDAGMGLQFVGWEQTRALFISVVLCMRGVAV